MKIYLKSDLKMLFSDFKWRIKGMLDEDGNIYPIPTIPQVITGIFQEITKHKVKKFMKEKYGCEIVQGGPREYPEITLMGGEFGDRKIAIEMKTTRMVSENRISGFTIGSFAGYFLHPEKKMPGCKFPYGEFDEHWIIGFIYTWNSEVDTLHMVSDVEVVVQPKWKIASESTGTGTTFAIGSIKDIDKLRKGEGVFKSKEDFENYWRERGKEG
ncbi:MAG: type II restriction endonuclease [bacterium]|nr:type II restriction endonuclease [bacterium]